MTFDEVRFLVASDVFLACLFPCFILILGYKHLPSLGDIRTLLSLSPRHPITKHGYFSLERAYHSYVQYARLSAAELSKMRSAYTKLSRAHRRLGNTVGYPAKLDQLHDVTGRNATLADGIADLAEEEFAGMLKDGLGMNGEMGTADLGRVREALKHYVRDWSEEGKDERTRIFAPILEFLKETGEESNRAGKKVLVPGCGLGRLAWEISELGFETTANELSFFMTLAFRFLLSPKTTTTVNEHSLRPYAHWFSHQRSNDSLFRCISFPDAIPRLSSNFRLIEEDFLQLPIPSSKSSQTRSYDYIVTLFFIDTSLDVFATMAHIFALLRPGGIWINLGPLLWTGGAQAAVELSLEEVLHAADEIGFLIEMDESGPAARRTVECEYTGDKNAMMRWIYKAEFWVARKPR